MQNAALHARASWILLGALTLRMTLNAFWLEPNNDEGMWLWNPRCDSLGLNADGILHQALSPVSYWLYRGLFEMAGPSLVLPRQLGVVVGALTLAGITHCFIKRGEALAACVMTSWMWLDPYSFRGASYAMLEPFMMACIAWVWHEEQRNDRPSARPVLQGVALGLLLATKILGAWLLAGLLLHRCLHRRWRDLALTGGCAALIALAAYASIWQGVDHGRFIEIWKAHTEGRNSLFGGVRLIIASHDFTLWPYLITIALWAWLRLPRWRALTAFDLAIAVAAVHLLQQGFMPQRYWLPPAFLAMLLLAPMVKDIRLSQMSKVMLGGGCLALLASQAVLFQIYVRSPSNAGGRAAMRVIRQALDQRLQVAAPPSLAIPFREPILATSTNMANRPPPAAFSGLYVLNTVAPGPTPAEQLISTLPRVSDHPDQNLGRYILSWHYSSPSLSPTP